ncbi:molybdopterin-dependent oxidoreductase [Desulfovibrio sp. OttesenSCG-928-G15]|nr:molybdopterin-dependent oxidoreductase [Desulfovibrio sp. OttesenSCG-928-G15]
MKFVAGASAGIMVTPLPWKLLDDVSIWSQNWSWIPRNQYGESTFTQVFSKMDPTGVPMHVRLVGGRPTRILPAENHPLGGGVTSLAVAEVQMLHSPARVKRPLLRSGDGGYTEMEWDDALGLLQKKFSEAGSDVAFLSGDEFGSTTEVLSAFAAELGSDKVFVMPSEAQCAASASRLMNIQAQIGYDLEKSDCVLAIGANILESWGTVVRNRRIFRENRPHSFKKGDETGPAASQKLLYAGSVQNHTAAVSNAWLPIYPGTEGILVMGIAALLIGKGRFVKANDFPEFRALALRYTPEELVKQTGVDPKKLEEVVDMLLAAKAPLVIVGSEFNQGLGAAPVIAGFAVNALLQNINKPGGLTLLPPASKAMEKAKSRSEIYETDFLSWLLGGNKPSMLVIHEANPVYSLPDPAGVKAALKDIPFKVSFTTFLDETAEQSDLIFPITMGIERIDDVETPYGCGKTIYCITGPAAISGKGVIAYSTANAILYTAQKMGKSLGYEYFNDVLKTKSLSHEKCSFDVLVSGQAAESESLVNVWSFDLKPSLLEKAFAPQSRGSTLCLAPVVKLNMGTAKTGIPPFNNKTLRATELDGSLMCAMMNGATASQRGLADGDAVTLASADGSKKIPAKLRVFEGVMNNTVAVCMGFGHTALDEFSQNKGANVMELMTAAQESDSGLSVWAKTGVTVSKS